MKSCLCDSFFNGCFSYNSYKFFNFLVFRQKAKQRRFVLPKPHYASVSRTLALFAGNQPALAVRLSIWKNRFAFFWQFFKMDCGARAFLSVLYARHVEILGRGCAEWKFVDHRRRIAVLYTCSPFVFYAEEGGKELDNSAFFLNASLSSREFRHRFVGQRKFGSEAWQRFHIALFLLFFEWSFSFLFVQR